MTDTIDGSIEFSIQPQPPIIYTGSTNASKPWYTSKTVWFNAVALIALILQAQYGFVLDEATQASIIVFANLILRSITKQEIT
jgi:hypothetical protein